jgi:hypothetical protein
MSDDELERAIEAIRAMLAAGDAGGSAKVIDGESSPVPALPAPRKAKRKRGAEAEASLPGTCRPDSERVERIASGSVAIRHICDSPWPITAWRAASTRPHGASFGCRPWR